MTNLPVPQERKSAMTEQQTPLLGCAWLFPSEWANGRMVILAQEVDRLRKELAQEKAHRIWLEGGEVDD